MEQLFLEDVHERLYKDYAPELPRNVILDTQDVVRSFIKTTDSLHEMGIIPIEAVSDILVLISRKNEAENKLLERYVEIKEDTDVEFCEADISGYLNSWMELANILLYQVNVLGLYKNGYLYYQICQVRKDCLILEKIYLPELNDDNYRNKRSNRWRGDFTYSRYLLGINV